MTPIIVALVAVLCFTGGAITSHVIWVQRLKNTDRLQRMLTAARRQGQVERASTKKEGLEPPTWLP